MIPDLCAECRRKVMAAKADQKRRRKAKALPTSVVHHAKERRAEEAEAETVKADAWQAVLDRTWRDHRGRQSCESCHQVRALEPHHLELGAGGRRDAPEVVMALCAECHRIGDVSAHLTPKRFAQTVVVPWAQAHGYSLPNRKEYRT